MGSIGGGGRYADLTGVFGMPGLPGVGISFGADRIYDVLEGLSLFPETLDESVKILFAAFDEATHDYAFCLRQPPARRRHRCGSVSRAREIEKQFEYVAKTEYSVYGHRRGDGNAEWTLQVKNQSSGEQSFGDGGGIGGDVSLKARVGAS